MFQDVGKKFMPVVLGATLLAGCKNDAKQEEVPYNDQGNGVFLIKGGHDNFSSDAFGKNLSKFKEDHPDLKIDLFIPTRQDQPTFFDAVITTRPSGDSTSRER